MTVYTGIAATGKTSSIIKAMIKYKEDGGAVKLFLSAEHPNLTNRPNVKPGGLMGCREPGLRFPIDHVLKTTQTIEMLEKLDTGTLAVFDEAQYFKPEIVEAWNSAAARGVKIMVGTPSEEQQARLKKQGHEPTELTVTCSRCDKKANSVAHEEGSIIPIHLCSDCSNKQYQKTLDELHADIRKNEPFPDEDKTYQPFYNVDVKGWSYVRPDSLSRFRLIEDAVQRCKALKTGDTYTYLDLGCCSGYFCDAMTSLGYFATGVDVQKNLIDWAKRMASLKGQNINYSLEDAKKFITKSDEKIDVTSTFATVQWVMAQQGYDVGIECFKHLFDRTKHVCVVEMGYTKEDIYKDKIPDKPKEIDKNWVLEIMQEHGGFAEIEVHPAGENGIWRDIFVGFKEVPAQRDFRRDLQNEKVDQISTAQQSWDDKWIGENFEVFFEAREKLATGRIEGWVPERKDGIATQVAIILDGVEVENFTVEGGDFEQNFKCDYDAGKMFGFKIKSTPFDMSGSKDERPLAFVLRKLSFN